MRGLGARLAVTVMLACGCQRPLPPDGLPDPDARPRTPDEIEKVKLDMEEIAGALGVDCGYCHVPGERWTVETPNKRITRIMMRRFTGRLVHDDGARLECHDCHAGKARFLGDRAETGRIKAVMKGFTRRFRRAGPDGTAGARFGCDACHVDVSGKPAARFLPRALPL